MNVFVLCTGRCGSLTFSKACGHISNFSCAHESRTALLGDQRFDYPSNHIEVDNRLSWLLGRLERHYGNDAIYVHLKRETELTAQSYARRAGGWIMQAYSGTGILMKLPEDTDPLLLARDYCDTVNSNIEHFLANKSRKMVFNLEHAETDFLSFWQLINAEGDQTKALACFKARYNAYKGAASQYNKTL